MPRQDVLSNDPKWFYVHATRFEKYPLPSSFLPEGDLHYIARFQNIIDTRGLEATETLSQDNHMPAVLSVLKQESRTNSENLTQGS